MLETQLSFFHSPGKRRIFSILFFLLLLAACSQQPEDGVVAVDMVAQAIETKFIEAPIESSKSPDDTLAYTHDVYVELDGKLIPARLESLRSSCVALKSACTVMSMESRGDRYSVTAGIGLRLSPEKVSDMTALAAKDATITSKQSAAEDLASSIKDNEKRLASLAKYREQLNNVLARKDINPDQLIAVSKELATTQSQIEELSMDRSKIQQRIDTELLTIRLSSPDSQRSTQQTPIKDAFLRFGTNFSFAVAAVIEFIAGFVPWLLVIVPGIAALRWAWRRFGKIFGRSDTKER